MTPNRVWKRPKVVSHDCPKTDPKSAPKWTPITPKLSLESILICPQNGSQINPETEPGIHPELVLKMDPKWTPKLIPIWPQNGPQIAPKFWGQGGFGGDFHSIMGSGPNFGVFSTPFCGQGGILGAFPPHCGVNLVSGGVAGSLGSGFPPPPLTSRRSSGLRGCRWKKRGFGG